MCLIKHTHSPTPKPTPKNTARHAQTTGRQAAALAPSPRSSRGRSSLSMVLGGGSGLEEAAGAFLDPTAAAASVAFLGSLLNVAEEVRFVRGWASQSISWLMRARVPFGGC